MLVYSKFGYHKQLALPIEYVGARPAATAAAAADQPRSHSWNLALLGFLILAVLGYIFLANYVVAKRYGLELLHRQLNQANIRLEIASSEIEGIFSIERLSAFAKSSGMVEAKDVDSIFEEPGVALTRHNN